MVTKIVESENSLSNFKKEYQESKYSLVIPVFDEPDFHPNETETSFLVVSLENQNVYIFCLNHMESCREFKLQDLFFLYDDKEKFVYNKKKFIQCFEGDTTSFIDLELLHWFKTNSSLNFQILPEYFSTFQRSGHKIKSSHLPLFQILDFYENKVQVLHDIVSNHSDTLNENSFQKYNNDIIKVFSEIENKGIFVNTKKFHKVFKSKINRKFSEKVYSEYNIYTSTGRPSNSNYNINFAALNSSENQKEPIISRFSRDGVLVLFDYDAFHLRLIGKLIGYDLPKESFHTYLGKKYFGEKEISEKQYEDSKKISFQFLYGQNIEEARNIEFFDQTYNLKESIWEAYKKYGIIQTPKFKRSINGKHINNMNPGKAFSYILQSYETEYNVGKIKKILSLLKKYESQLILYTYDSLLFDYSFSDGKALIQKIKKIMENDEMLIKGYVGNSFGNMKKIGMGNNF